MVGDRFLTGYSALNIVAISVLLQKYTKGSRQFIIDNFQPKSAWSPAL